MPSDRLLIALKAKTLLKETITHYNKRHSDLFCAMISLSQAYDRININTFCTKLKRTELPEQIPNKIECMYRNTSVNTVYGGQPRGVFSL